MGQKVINEQYHRAFLFADRDETTMIIPAEVLMEILYLFERNRIKVDLIQTEDLLKSVINRRLSEELNSLEKVISVHGGALADLGNGLTQTSFAPQCGQIYCSYTVGVASEIPVSPSRYLVTVSRFLLLGAINP